MRKVYRSIKRKLSTWLERSSLGFRLLLRRRYGVTGPHGFPDAPWYNAVLKNQEEVDRAISQERKLGLPIMVDPAKNWDNLAALDLILQCTGKDARIFDAGGEIYSMILPWLFLYGYKNLSAGNLVFQTTVKKGPIVYHFSDITQTGFAPASFDAITCLSVIEHGVNIPSYFSEMSRILKPGGLLITSADYFETQVDTKGLFAYGVPVHIFIKKEILEALNIAEENGFELLNQIDLRADQKPVYVKEWNISYTFIIFSLRKIIKD